MKKLFQIAACVNSGSVGRIAEQIGQIAIENGFDSYIAYARTCSFSKSNVIKIGTVLDVLWHGVQTRLFDNHGYASKRATRKLIIKIEALKPSIILLHNLHGYYINIKILFDYLSKINTPVVWVFHDCWSFTGHCAYFDYIRCDKWQDSCRKCQLIHSYPKTLFFDRSERNYVIKKNLFTSIKYLTIVPVSYWLGDLVSKSFLKNYPIKVIQNGVDIHMFSPQEQDDLSVLESKYGLAGKKVLLGVASCWDERKGLYDFLKLHFLLKNDIAIILVGLRKKQIKLLPDGINGILRTESVNQLAQFYSLADIFINPTYEDTFPTTNLESLACGTPVITYRTGGSVESVSNDVGRVVNKGDINGLLIAINELLSIGKKSFKMACRQKAVNEFNKDDRFKDYIKLFNSLLGDKLSSNN